MDRRKRKNQWSKRFDERNNESAHIGQALEEGEEGDNYMPINEQEAERERRRAREGLWNDTEDTEYYNEGESIEDGQDSWAKRIDEAPNQRHWHYPANFEGAATGTGKKKLAKKSNEDRWERSVSREWDCTCSLLILSGHLGQTPLRRARRILPRRLQTTTSRNGAKTTDQRDGRPKRRERTVTVMPMPIQVAGRMGTPMMWLETMDGVKAIDSSSLSNLRKRRVTMCLATSFRLGEEWRGVGSGKSTAVEKSQRNDPYDLVAGSIPIVCNYIWYTPR